jgi:two-component system, NtrC family, response regulator AtoC
MNVDLKSVTPAALQCLMGYAWPGNNRQLENEVKRLIAFVRGTSIKEEHLDSTQLRQPCSGGARIKGAGAGTASYANPG